MFRSNGTDDLGSMQQALNESLKREDKLKRTIVERDATIVDLEVMVNEARPPETDAERANREADHWAKVFGPPPGYRRTDAAEGAAYCRAAGPTFKGTGVGFFVPINFHLTRGEWVDWRSPDYLVECPHCGGKL